MNILNIEELDAFFEAHERHSKQQAALIEEMSYGRIVSALTTGTPRQAWKARHRWCRMLAKLIATRPQMPQLVVA